MTLYYMYTKNFTLLLKSDYAYLQRFAHNHIVFMANIYVLHNFKIFLYNKHYTPTDKHPLIAAR